MGRLLMMETSIHTLFFMFYMMWEKYFVLACIMYQEKKYQIKKNLYMNIIFLEYTHATIKMCLVSW